MDAMEIKKRMDAARARGGAGEMIAMVREMEAMQFESDLRWTRIGYVVGAVITLGAGVALVAGGLSFLSVPGDGPGLSMLVAGAFALVFGSAFVFAAWAFAPPPTDLRGTGIPAKVTIEDFRSAFGSLSVGSTDNKRQVPRVAIDLQVSPSEGAPYRVTIKQHVSGSDLVAIQIGATFEAFVDRTRPERILVLFGG